MSNNKVYVIGHKNPDTDSICSAAGYAAFKNAAGNTTSYIPRRAGSLNPETEFVLNRFGIEAPELMENASGETVILVDHNEKAQAADNITTQKILEILDHHKLGDVQTAEPLYVRMMPVGCTGTIVYLHYCEAGLTPDKTSREFSVLQFSPIHWHSALLPAQIRTVQLRKLWRR